MSVDTAILILLSVAALLMVGAIGLVHSAACVLHVWAVDSTRSPRGRFYRYCLAVSRLTRWM
jgi:hypothetical protein